MIGTKLRQWTLGISWLGGSVVHVEYRSLTSEHFHCLPLLVLSTAYQSAAPAEDTWLKPARACRQRRQHLAFITHADDSGGGKASSGVSLNVCNSVCLSVRTIKPKQLKLQSTNIPRWQSIVSPRQSISGQKVKGQGHRITKCKNILKAIEWSAWVMHSISV